MSLTRRKMLLHSGAALAGGAFLHYAGEADARETVRDMNADGDPPWKRPALEPGTNYRPVTTPDGSTLEYRVVDGVKVFHLIAEPVRHEFMSGLEANCWGYNGQVHGPTIEAVEGDRVRIYVTNKLPAPTTIHWHGALLPSGMDGVGGLNQRLIQPGETFKYEWTFAQHGTLMYHPHHDSMTQLGKGLMGMLIVHPRSPADLPEVDRDFALLLSEWFIRPGAERPDPNVMDDFNVLTINARSFPGTSPLTAQKGDRVRIRIGNLSAMSHHPIHIHGHKFQVVETDGGRIPSAAQWPEATIKVAVGQIRTVEFVADNPGDWAVHCHMTHHTMNQMGHGIPNMIGMDPEGFDERVQSLMPDYMTMGHTGMGEHGQHVAMGHMQVPRNSVPMVGVEGPRDYISMGGMATLLKVREEIEDYDEDPGWYENPEGTEAMKASEEEMERDGIDA